MIRARPTGSTRCRECLLYLYVSFRCGCSLHALASYVSAGAATYHAAQYHSHTTVRTRRSLVAHFACGRYGGLGAGRPQNLRRRHRTPPPGPDASSRGARTHTREARAQQKCLASTPTGRIEGRMAAGGARTYGSLSSLLWFWRIGHCQVHVVHHAAAGDLIGPMDGPRAHTSSSSTLRMCRPRGGLFSFLRLMRASILWRRLPSRGGCY